MDSLVTYVNNTFSAVPQTEEIKKLKSKILDRMSNRYDILKSEGKNDNEITGIIISEFSNISELINEQINNHNMNNPSNDKKNITINNTSINSKIKIQIIGAVLSSYWPIVVATYLFLNFNFGLWRISWIIFPLAPAFKNFLHNYYDE